MNLNFLTSLSMEQHLELLRSKLLRLLAQQELADIELNELLSILENVSYMRLYLQANEEFVDFSDMSEKLESFYKDAALREQIVAALNRCQCQEQDSDFLRLKTLRSLQQSEGVVQDENELMSVKKIRGLDEQRTESASSILKKLGFKGVSHPSVEIYSFLSSEPDPDKRQKVETLYKKVMNLKSSERHRYLDEIVENRWRMGYPLKKSLEDSQLSIGDVGQFVESSLVKARDHHRNLFKHVADELQLASAFTTDWPFFLKAKTNFKGMQFNLNKVLEFCIEFASSALGIKFEYLGERHNLSTHAISANGSLLGYIKMDIWDTTSKSVKVNQTIPVKNKMKLLTETQLPVAYLACRVDSREGEGSINFQHIHGLMHEFGHALNHVLIEGNIPTYSGLDYLPLERLEYFSYWFEKWAYHPLFVEKLSCGDREVEEEIRNTIKVKFWEYNRVLLDRAVLAYLDFKLHEKPGRNFHELFTNMQNEFELEDIGQSSDLIEYFYRPMFQAHPGANFVYLWGISRSCDLFLPFLQSQDSIFVPSGDHFETVFNYSAKDPVVADIDSIIRFFKCF